MTQEYFLERRLKCLDEIVTIKVLRPQITEFSNYKCTIIITGLSKNYRSSGVGEDTIGAVMMAFLKVGNIIYNSPEYRAGTLSYENELPSKNLGFPIFRTFIEDFEDIDIIYNTDE